MQFVIRIISVALSICFITLTGCKEEQPKQTFDNLVPEAVTPKKPGFIKAISPYAFVDSINAGVNLRMYFIQDTPPDDPSYIVAIPGIKDVDMSTMFRIAETLAVGDPIYLVSLYTSDARRFAKEISNRGHDCYFLDGGTYLLSGEMKLGKIRFSSQTGTSITKPKMKKP